MLTNGKTGKILGKWEMKSGSHIAVRHRSLNDPLCPDLDIASQGHTIEEAKEKLKEAVSLFFEYASRKR